MVLTIPHTNSRLTGHILYCREPAVVPCGPQWHYAVHLTQPVASHFKPLFSQSGNPLSNDSNLLHSEGISSRSAAPQRPFTSPAFLESCLLVAVTVCDYKWGLVLPQQLDCAPQVAWLIKSFFCVLTALCWLLSLWLLVHPVFTLHTLPCLLEESMGVCPAQSGWPT